MRATFSKQNVLPRAFCKLSSLLQLLVEFTITNYIYSVNTDQKQILFKTSKLLLGTEIQTMAEHKERFNEETIL